MCQRARLNIFVRDSDSKLLANPHLRSRRRLPIFIKLSHSTKNIHKTLVSKTLTVTLDPHRNPAQESMEEGSVFNTFTKASGCAAAVNTPTLTSQFSLPRSVPYLNAYHNSSTSNANCFYNHSNECANRLQDFSAIRKSIQLKTSFDSSSFPKNHDIQKSYRTYHYIHSAHDCHTRANDENQFDLYACASAKSALPSLADTTTVYISKNISQRSIQSSGKYINRYNYLSESDVETRMNRPY